MNRITLVLFVVLSFNTACNTNKKVAETTTTSKEIQEEKPRDFGGASQEQQLAQYEEMVDQLNLSDDQRAEFDAINEKYLKEFMELRQNSDLDFASFREQAKGIRQQQTAEVRALLTEEQFAGYEELLRKRREQRQRGRSDSGRG